jgi:hypothetical protein
MKKKASTQARVRSSQALARIFLPIANFRQLCRKIEGVLPFFVIPVSSRKILISLSLWKLLDLQVVAPPSGLTQSWHVLSY